jgi:hypothetical protein
VVPVLAVLVAIGPASPSGRYTADPRYGIEGDYYWKLSNAKVELVHADGRIDYGRYLRTNGVWIWIDDRRATHYTSRILPSWWRLRAVDDATGERLTWGYRRLW